MVPFTIIIGLRGFEIGKVVLHSSLGRLVLSLTVLNEGVVAQVPTARDFAQPRLTFYQTVADENASDATSHQSHTRDGCYVNPCSSHERRALRSV
jgi:hypothetical protein